jgi:hypothetical protein
MKTRTSVAIGILFASAVVLLMASAATAASGRDQPAVTDLTGITAPVEPGTVINFKVNYTDPDDHPANYHTLDVDETGHYLMEQLDPSDMNASDGMFYVYNLTLPGGTHHYHFHFADAGNWTNTTDTSIEVLYAPSAGDWTVSGPLVVSNATIEMKGNLIVASGGALELRNTTIKFNGDTDGKYRIEVQAGGSLKVLDGSIITKSTGAKAYNFIVKPGATAFEMHSSEVWFCGWAGATNNLTGLFTEAASSLIDNCLVASGYQGVIQENGKLVIQGSTIKDSQRHNLEATNATIAASDCTFLHSVDACDVEFFTGTTATVTNCVIKQGGHNCFWIKDGVTATIQGCTISDAHENGVWLDGHCTLTIKDTVISNNPENGTWINGSCTVTMTNVTIKNNQLDGVYVSGSKLTMTGCTVETNELHGVSGYDSDITFTRNFVNNSKRHNYETTNSTSVLDSCTFLGSRDACNIEFFQDSKATVKNLTVIGAGHNCFWMSGNAEATITDSDLSQSPHNVIWLDMGCKVTVRNCVMHDVPEDGVNCTNSTAIVDSCTIKNCGGWGINCINSSLTYTNVNFSNNKLGEVSVQNYLSVKITDSKGKAVSGAGVTIKDQTKALVLSAKTGSDGSVASQMLPVYKVDNTGKKTDYTYTVSASKGDLEGSQKASSGAVTVAMKAKAKPQPGFEAIAVLVALIGVAMVAAGRRRN